MTFRILAGKFFACLGTGLLLLTIFAVMQQGVEAAGGIVCTGCFGCSGATVNGPNVIIVVVAVQMRVELVAIALIR
jgi:hypothetical protein